MIRYFIENEQGEWLRYPAEGYEGCWTRDPLEAWGFDPVKATLKLLEGITEPSINSLTKLFLMEQPGSDVLQWLVQEDCGDNLKITEHEFIDFVAKCDVDGNPLENPKPFSLVKHDNGNREITERLMYTTVEHEDDTRDLIVKGETVSGYRNTGSHFNEDFSEGLITGTWRLRVSSE